MNAQDLKNGLTNYYGSETMFRHGLNRNIVYTEGVQFFAENAGGGAYWFIDILATQPEILLLQQREFADIKLVVAERSATIIVGDGNDNEVYRRVIEFTDCPEGEWKFFMIGGTIMLTSEY